MRLFRYLAIFMLLVTHFPSFGQDYQVVQLFREGNRLFENQQYIRAMRFFKEVLEKDPDFAGALYQMGECHRLTLDYETALYYYKKVVENERSRFPLARLYYAQMLKYTGEYNQAVQNFEEFQEYIHLNNLEEDEKYRDFYTQSHIEKEGSLMALNDLTNPKPDKKFVLADKSINSPYMDYAAFTYGDEQFLCVTSSREGGKGKLIDYRFGESFADIYRYEKVDSNSWEIYKASDKFESQINTKFGEGSGTFNREADKFYFTECVENSGDVCHIYVSSLVDGNWTEPKPLGESINQNGINSRHPYVTPGGDTLFFASDKPGGAGGYDIWMSINAGEDNWSQAQHLGDQINTPFNELSPFFDPVKNALFFASDGHRGYGGFDIFVASGISLFLAEIYNLGFPFNSNRDEFFFFAGKNTGYLSSNRDGGVGKLDIYQFDVSSGESIITEITSDEFVAGMNSLFSDDYDFDFEDVESINEIISTLLAANIADVDLVLTDELAEIYSSLSLDDKERINRIIQARMRKLNETELQALRIEDEFYYHELSTTDKNHMDHIIMTYLQENELAMSVSIPEDDKAFYESLSIENREKADFLIASRVKEADDFIFATENYDNLSIEEKKKVDDLTLELIEQKKNIDDIPLSPNQAMFLNGLDEEKKEQVYDAIKERVLTYADDKGFVLSEEDRIFYQNLTSDHHDALKDIAEAFVVSDVENLEANITPELLAIFDLYNSSQREQLDRILLKLINNVLKSDLYFAQTNMTPEARAALENLRPEDIATFLNDHMSNLNVMEEIEVMERFLQTSAQQWDNAEEIFPSPEDIRQVAEARRAAGIEEGIIEATRTELALNNENNSPGANDNLSNGESTQPGSPNNSTGITEDMADLNNGALQSNEISNSGSSPTTIAPIASGQNIVSSLDLGDINFYENLTEEEKKIIDRNIASEYLREVDANQAFEDRDEQYLKNLTPTEKTYLKLLTKEFTSGEELKPEEKSALNEAFSFYSNLSPAVKEIWNRAVAREILENENGQYKLSPEDASFISQLTDEQKERLDHIKAFRFANDRILGEDLVVESNDLASSTIDFTMARFNSGDYRYISVSGQLINNNTGVPLANAAVNIVNERDEIVIQARTNKSGYFDVQDLRSGKYRVILANAADNASAINAPIFVKDLKVTGSETNQLSKSKKTTIYFDFDSDQLRPEALITLREIASVYKSQNIKITMYAHTDNLGTSSYNQQLSVKRNETAIEALQNLGVKMQDINYKSFGQNQPVAPNDNPYGRQFNRRLEISLSSDIPIDYSPADIYMVRPKGTLYSICKNFKVDIDEVRAYNGIEGNNIQAFKPLRIPNRNNVKPNLNMLVKLNNAIARPGNNYVVKPNETVESIAKKFNLPEELIMEMNDLSGMELVPGQQLKIYVRNSN